MKKSHFEYYFSVPKIICPRFWVHSKILKQTTGWWNDFKINLDIELENTVRERNVAHNQNKSRSQFVKFFTK